jgi:GNAT superfamily N-acetyltransferase
MNDVIVRHARADELECVRATYAEWGYGGGVAPEDVVLVAERDGQLVGLVRRTSESGTVMLRGMQVAPDARNRGIGTRLLEAFVEELGAAECYCVPYAHLVAFYGSKGFEVQPVETGPWFLSQRIAEYRAAGLDVVLMRRSAA